MNTNRWFAVATLVSTTLVSGAGLKKTYADDSPKHGDSRIIEKSAEEKIKAAIARMPEADRASAAAQRYCPMMGTVRLGAMGVPVKLLINDKQVFVCCKGCQEEAVEHGKETLSKAEKLKRIAAAITKLPAGDQALVEAQMFCAVAKENRLGSMGIPVKLMLEGKPVFLCCEGCEGEARANPKATLAQVEAIKKKNAEAGHHSGHNHEHKN